MSRFADPAKVEVVPLGVCQCPGTPHEQDEATIRWDISGSALARIGRAEIEGAVRMDPLASYRQIALETLASWNLIDGASVAAINPATIAELDVDTLKVIAEEADKLIGSKGTLPNVPGAPSVASSLGSASPIRKRTRMPTT